MMMIIIYIITTSSNERLWECVRRRNFNTDTLMIYLSDFQPLSIAKVKNLLSSTTGVLLKIFSDKVHDWRSPGTNYVAWRPQFL